MSRLQAIENALSSINDAVFQELCDCFLALKNSNYSLFSRTGSQKGKQKTIKGTPDSFLLLPSGKYIFVEYSTNIKEGLTKLEKDLKKDIDTTKTGIPLSQIAEIIFCVNFKLKTSEIQSLITLLDNSQIILTVYTLDSLSIELHLNHRNLTHKYLGLPIDTGQIVSVEKFISEYNRASQGISTPLDNTFLHRHEELKKLKDTISFNDFVILTGAPGIGKTKLALEGINSFLSENLSFEAYCVSYKNHTLLEDLYQYFDSEKDYILFVDDANRIDAFCQITGFYKASRKGKLKILITVRDYAFQDIGMLCQDFSPVRFDLAKFSDEQIIDIIKAQPFEILNPDYHKEIIRIAEGNPRMAIMTSLLAKKHQDLYVLHNVSDLFENYFSTFIKDNGEFAKEINIKSLGLISFFSTIPYKNREVVTPILSNFEINYSSFIDAIDKLEKLELVDIRYDYVKIPEQNLSTYFFYKTFIKENLLSFETLLNSYFDSNTKHFIDCVIPANNTFGYENVIKKIRPLLLNYWIKIEAIEDKALKFLSTFWYYMQSEALAFLFNITELLPSVSSVDYQIYIKSNSPSSNKNEVIELLGEFLRFPDALKDVIELGFEFIRKRPELISEWINKINTLLIFDKEDHSLYQFKRQFILFEVLIEGLKQNDPLFSTTFYEVSKTFLLFKYHHTRWGRNNTFLWYDYQIPSIPEIQLFRQNIWTAVDNNYETHPDASFNLLSSYSEISPDVNKEIMELDISFVINIINKHLNENEFEHCKYVQEQIKWCKRNSVLHPSFDSLMQNFSNPTYKAYLVIDWDMLGEKESYEFNDYGEFERLKEEEIRSSFVFRDNNEIKDFLNIFSYIKKKTKNEWNFSTTLDYVIDENFSKNFEIGCLILLEIIKRNNEMNYIPSISFRNNLKTVDQTNKIWNIIEQQVFLNKGLWELSFYNNIDDSLLSKSHVRSLIHTVSCIKESTTIHFDRLQRFLVIEPNLFQIILRIIVDKNKNEEIRLQVWMDFFSNHFDQLGDDLELIKCAYLQQDIMQSRFDYYRKGFLNILTKDSKFLIEYVNSLYPDNHSIISKNHKNLEFVWLIDNIEEVLNSVFDLIIEKEPFFYLEDHFCNSFFRKLQKEKTERASKFLLDYCKLNYADANKMNVIVDIARHSMKELFEDVLLLFLSLSQDKELFSKIWWRGIGTTGSGNVILADIEMADWMNILTIIDKSPVGFKLIPIKNYLNEQIASCQKRGDLERQRRFLERF